MSLGPLRERRPRVGLRGELLLALMPTATVLVVLAMGEVPGHQRLPFASLASSAFLIYLSPSMPSTACVRWSPRRCRPR